MILTIDFVSASVSPLSTITVRIAFSCNFAQKQPSPLIEHEALTTFEPLLSAQSWPKFMVLQTQPLTGLPAEICEELIAEGSDESSDY